REALLDRLVAVAGESGMTLRKVAAAHSVEQLAAQHGLDLANAPRNLDEWLNSNHLQWSRLVTS
ncbi:MAG: hypothetical protein M3290_13340, partial [Actinomycetota bacterium]|nr:hypothetical protein [Actinomycetota bacterium]